MSKMTFPCIKIALLIIFILPEVFSTIDITLTEYTYLANHLHPEECRKLVAALHFKSYNKPNALDEAERKVPEDIPCLDQLLHWNNAKGEGRGETHEVVVRALHHIDRPDLAEWLGKTVFNQLGEKLENGLENVLSETSSTTETTPSLILITERVSESESVWRTVDSISILLIILMSVATFVILGIMLIRHTRNKQLRFSKGNPSQYSIVSKSDSGESETETTLSVNREMYKPLI